MPRPAAQFELAAKRLRQTASGHFDIAVSGVTTSPN